MRTTFAAAILATALTPACSDDEDVTSPACTSPAPLGRCWEQLLPPGSGGFPADPGNNDAPKWAPGKFPLTLFPVVAFDDELWMTSQTHSFSAPDGLTWTQHDKVDWGERISQSYAFFDSQLWMFGGLDYATREPLRDIWSSPDGVEWQKAGDAAWPARKGHAVVAFRGRLWLFGGTTEVDARFNSVHMLSDVWSSDDGLNWSQVTSAAPWTARDEPAVVVLRDQLYLLGGDGHADVWRSADGESWTQLASETAWGEGRRAFGRAAFADKLWVFGGFIGASTNALNDVWSSADGMSWTQEIEHAQWRPRSPRSIVYEDKIWIFSGKHTGADDNWGGDLWVLPAGP